jgi:hypothetical protein
LPPEEESSDLRDGRARRARNDRVCKDTIAKAREWILDASYRAQFECTSHINRESYKSMEGDFDANILRTVLELTYVEPYIYPADVSVVGDPTPEELYGQDNLAMTKPCSSNMAHRFCQDVREYFVISTDRARFHARETKIRQFFDWEFDHGLEMLLIRRVLRLEYVEPSVSMGAYPPIHNQIIQRWRGLETPTPPPAIPMPAMSVSVTSIHAPVFQPERMEFDEDATQVCDCEANSKNRKGSVIDLSQSPPSSQDTLRDSQSSSNDGVEDEATAENIQGLPIKRPRPSGPSKPSKKKRKETGPQAVAQTPRRGPSARMEVVDDDEDDHEMGGPRWVPPAARNIYNQQERRSRRRRRAPKRFQ